MLDYIADCSKKLAEGMILDKVPDNLKPTATCIIETGNAANCSKGLILQQLPPDMRDQADKIVNCLGGSNPASCVASSAVPDEIKPLMACATSPNVGQCVADLAAKDLPDGVAKNMVGCVGAGADFGKCAAQKGITSAEDLAKSQVSKAQQEAIQKALDTIDRLRPDAPYTIEAGPNKSATIKNIMMVAEGIQQRDWGKLAMGAGPELVKIASGILLSIFLTPALAGVLSPAVEAMINNDVAAAQRALDAVGKGDPVKLAQVIFEWYENSFIDKPCALVGDSKARDTICGGLSDAIKFISNNAADLAKKILGAGKDILEWIGVWGTVDDTATFVFNTLKDAVNKLGKFLGFGSDEWKAPRDCGSPARESPTDYLANHFLACLPKAAALNVSGRGADTAKLKADCNSYFNRCTDPKKRGAVAEACNAMSASLSNLSDQTSNGVKAAAQAYTDIGIGMASIANDAYKSWQSGNLNDLCDANFWQNSENVYAQKCAAFVNGPFPLAPTSSPGGGTNACSAIPTPSRDASKQACIASLRAASAAKKGALAGPDSDLCKKQKEYFAAHPCTYETSQRTVPGSGQKFDEPKNINCREKLRPNFQNRTTPDVLPKQSAPGTLRTLPGVQSATPRVLPSNAGARQSPAGQILNRGRSAVDTLGDAMSENSFGNVAGNAGGPALSRHPSSVPSGPRILPAKSSGNGGVGAIDGGKPPLTSKGIPRNSGGSGGIGMVNGASGNAPVTKGKSQSSGNAASRFDNEPIDYGGCAGCGKPKRLDVR